MIPLYRVFVPDGALEELGIVLQSDQIASGPKVEEFESLLANFIGNPYVTATSDLSGSLKLSLYMAGVRPGDEVLTSPLACVATNLPIKNLFATPVWCDVNPETGNISPEDIERKITEKSKAILVYHWAGNPADMHAIMLLAYKYGLKVVEDASEAFGGVYGGLRIGNTGSHFTVFSFNAIRHITTIEGSAIAFGDKCEYERGRWLKRYGIHQPSFRDSLGEIDPSSDIQEAGFFAFMNHISASLGVLQMKQAERIVRNYQENGLFFDEALKNMSGINLLKKWPKSVSAYWVYAFCVDNRDALLRAMRDRGVYASKLHLRNDTYTCFKNTKSYLPGVDFFQSHNLNIPCGWWVGPKEREHIVASIRQGW